MSNFMNLQEIDNLRQNNKTVLPQTYSKGIQREVKELQNYKNGEILFDYLLEYLSKKRDYDRYDVTAFQRGVGTLVRYAPDTKNSRYYFNLVLSEYETPLRTPTLELTLLNNLLYVHSLHDMEGALTLLKTALEIKVFQFQVKEYYKYQPTAFNNPLEVLEDISYKILRHHNLKFNHDKTAIESKY